MDQYNYTPNDNNNNQNQNPNDTGYNWNTGEGQNNPYGAPNGYTNPTPGYTPPLRSPVAEMREKNETMSLVFGIISLVLCNPLCIFSVLAIVFGLKARNLSESGKLEGKALGGVICGGIGIGIFALSTILMIFYIVLGVAMSMI